MKIDPTFKSAYPKTSKWIEKNMPTVSSKPKVWKAFVKYSELKSAAATLALTPGKLPEIHFEHMPGSNGRFKGSKFPDRIFLAKEICDKFEKSDSTNPKMHLLVESTLLHEMVHWGDWKDSKDQAGEEGKAFEKAAYGKDIGRYW